MPGARPDPGGRPNRFASIARQYEAHRSRYPAALAGEVIEAAGLKSGARLLEVGSGTGLATRLFTGRGYHITCLEPVEEMAAVARESLGNLDGVRFEATRFEDWTPPGEPYHLAFSGQAFHWIDPGCGYPKLARVLKPGGTAALFWYTPRLADARLAREVDAIYESLAPVIGVSSKQPSRFDDAGERLRSTAAFARLEQRSYASRRVDGRDEWLAMLGTTTDHLSLTATRRNALLAAIGDAIDRQGGRAVVRVETRLWLARRV